MPQRTPSNIRRPMTDRGFVRRRTKGPRVRGETQIVHEDTEYFVCRVDPANSTEIDREGRKGREITHTMICALDFINGLPLTFTEADKVIIERGFQGSTVYEEYGEFEVVSEVQVPRSLRKNLLHVMTLKKLEEH